MNLSDNIKQILITEKSVIQQDSLNNYTFKVSKKATKSSIAQDIERLFGVDVIDVKTAIVPGKPKRVRKTGWKTKTQNWKKATIRLKEGQKITLGTEK